MLIITFMSPAHYFSNTLQRTQSLTAYTLMISSKETSKILSPRGVAQYNLYGSLFALDLNELHLLLASYALNCYKGSVANTQALRKCNTLAISLDL